MKLIDSAENDLKSLTNLEYGTINIGASKTIIHEFLMPYIKSFHKDYPNINIRIFTDKTSDLIKKSKMGLIDVIFTNMPFNLPNKFESINVMNLHDCFVANENFNYLKNKVIDKESFQKLPLLVLTKGATNRIRLDDYCTINNITINPKMEFGSNTLIKEFTMAGFGIGMLTEENVKEEIKNGDLFKLNINFKLNDKYLGLVYNKDNLNLVSKKFIKYIKKNTVDKTQ